MSARDAALAQATGEALDREYHERVGGWAARLERDCYLRLGRGSALHRVGDVYHWRTPGMGAGDADTAADAVAACLHALTDEL